MQFDDRLATVLRMRAGSDAAARTQLRQLFDLLGSAGPGEESELLDAGYARLGELMALLAAGEQSRILREPGLRLRNARLVAFIAEGEPRVAAAAMAIARLTQHEWLELIPRLPVTARGFLRHRRDLPEVTTRLLGRLGIGDLVLPDPGIAAPVLELAAADEEQPDAPLVEQPAEAGGIGAILRRIEAFKEGRKLAGGPPRLPLGDNADQFAEPPPVARFDFATDTSGRVEWAGEPMAPFAVGLDLTAPRPGPLVSFGDAVASRLRRRLPLHALPISLTAAPALSGEWRIDAVPLFDQAGAFSGYRGRLHRPVAAPGDEAEDDGPEDLMRQVLHELRTPVNAIQGFAEIIQQQLFGAVPHEYRAHAAGIAVDAARLLAGFDEVDRLVRLKSAALTLDEGEGDMRGAVVETLRRLEGVLHPRNAGFDLKVSGSPFRVGFAQSEAMVLCWRLLATAAGALGAGEHVSLRLKGTEERVRLRLEVPRAIRETGESAGRDSRLRPAVTAGMFGPGFAFRLAQAEARAAGGSLDCEDERITLTLPALTAESASHSTGTG